MSDERVDTEVDSISRYLAELVEWWPNSTNSHPLLARCSGHRKWQRPRGGRGARRHRHTIGLLADGVRHPRAPVDLAQLQDRWV